MLKNSQAIRWTKLNIIKNKMSVGLAIALLALFGLMVVKTPMTAKAVASCTPTGFVRDSINLTAAQIGGDVTGALDATGCNIGVYYDANHTGKVKNANIYGSNYFGVVVNGGQGNVKVDITNSQIHNIGETPFNGSQHGNAIYYFGQSTAGTVKGSVNRNTVSQYQKGGIIINGEKADVDVHNNTVNGLGPVDFIAQNGIQISRGANGSVHNNTVTGNAYTGTNNASSGGILVYGGLNEPRGIVPGIVPLTTNVSVHNNTLIDNDVGVFLANYNADASAGPSTPTKISVHNNTISNDAVTNVSGNGYPVGYQAGISDSGNKDSIHNNRISGPGYKYADPGVAFVRAIDASAPYAIDPSVHNNTPEY